MVSRAELSILQETTGSSPRSCLPLTKEQGPLSPHHAVKSHSQLLLGMGPTFSVVNVPGETPWEKTSFSFANDVNLYFLFYFSFVNSSLIFFCVCLSACLFPKEREKEKAWSWVGGEVGRTWKELGEGKPRSKHMV